jgi:hypothetical protein
MNAKNELLDHIKDREVIYVEISQINYLAFPFSQSSIQGTLAEVLSLMDFEYDAEYGAQELFGTIWYSDGTWSDREEYDGSGNWKHRKCPPLPKDASIMDKNALLNKFRKIFLYNTTTPLQGNPITN